MQAAGGPAHLKRMQSHGVWDHSIAPILRVAPGDTIVVEMQNASGGQLAVDSAVSALATLDFARVNPVTGPVYVEGAKPGDTRAPHDPFRNRCLFAGQRRRRSQDQRSGRRSQLGRLASSRRGTARVKGNLMTQGGSRILEVAPEKLTPEQSTVLEAVQRGRGFLPTPFRIWLHSPKLAEHMEGLGTYLSTSSSLTEREYEIAVIVVVWRLASAFPLNAHVRGALKAGHPPAVVDALRDGREPELATDRERAIYNIARTANDPEPAADELFDQAVAALGREGLADVLGLIGYYTAVGVAMKLHRVPAPVA